jgi:hypothetical protein
MNKMTEKNYIDIKNAREIEIENDMWKMSKGKDSPLIVNIDDSPGIVNTHSDYQRLIYGGNR